MIWGIITVEQAVKNSSQRYNQKVNKILKWHQNSNWILHNKIRKEKTEEPNHRR